MPTGGWGMTEIRENLRLCRDELKGLAILWVVFFHAQLGLGGALGWVQGIGCGGVDMLLFLSGLGLYASLEKAPALGGYLKRRAARLLPAYLPFCALWLAVMIPALGLGAAQAVRTVMGNVFMLGYFADVPQMISWYVSLLALTLLLAPYLHAALNNAARPLLRGLFLMALSFLAGLCLIGDERYMAISRLPVFVLGMAFAARGKVGEPKAFAVRLAAVAALALGLAALWLCFSRYPELLNDYAMYWHPFALVAPAMCVLLSWGMSRMGKARAWLRPLRYLGRASLEIFLFNVWMELAVKRFALAQTPLGWALWSLGGVAAGCLYHEAVRRIASRLHPQKISQTGA